MSRSAVAQIPIEIAEEPPSQRSHLKIAPTTTADFPPRFRSLSDASETAERGEKNRRYSVELLERFKQLRRIRPAALGSMLVKLLGPDERRRIISVQNGVRIYVDPFSNLGGTLVEEGVFEADTEQAIRAHLRPGGIFLDIGANEGYFSALAAKIVGASGLVIAVEPQSRLRDIIEVNLRLNDVTSYRVYSNAFGGDDGTEGRINLWPSHNTGASSIVRSYRFSRETEVVRFVSLDRILAQTGIDKVDFVKVDVEGFEGEVVRHLVPHLKARRIGTLFLDYHASILAQAGIDPRKIHEEVVGCGYRMIAGQDDQLPLSSYRLYQPIGD